MKKFFFLILFLPFFSCQPRPAEKEPNQALETEVMRVHDEAMGDMDKIYRLRKNLRKLHDSLKTTNSDSAGQKKILQHVILLQHADEAMMEWMRRYKAPKHGQPADSVTLYLNQELHKIERVKSQIDSTIFASEQIQKQYELQQ